MSRASAGRELARLLSLGAPMKSDAPFALSVYVCRESCADPTHDPHYGRPPLCPDCAPDPWDADPAEYPGQECARCREPLDELERAEVEHEQAIGVLVLRAELWVELRARRDAREAERSLAADALDDAACEEIRTRAEVKRIRMARESAGGRA